MKYFIYSLMACALAVLVYSATFLNFDHLLLNNSGTALTCIFGALCVIVLLSILLVSKKIQQKVDQTES